MLLRRGKYIFGEKKEESFGRVDLPFMRDYVQHDIFVIN